MFIGTSNRISNLPPEIKRRFNLGTYFFYFPDAEEKKPIWDIYRKQYKLENDTSVVNDTNWTGPEIESCCRMAWLMKCDLATAAQRIVPVSRTAQEDITRMTDDAVGRYLSLSHPGVFQKPANSPAKVRGRTPDFN